MKLKIRTFLLAIIFLAAGRSYAQKTEIGILLGGSYYYGDIINTTYIQSQAIHQAGGLFLRKHLNKKFCLRVNLMYARLGAADSNLIDNTENIFQRKRNLAFFADVFEVSGVIEYNLIPDHNRGRRIKNRFIPYIYGGLGLFYFEPKAIHPITGNAIALRPLKLDGSSYSPVALAVPLGIGFRYYLTKNWQLGLDLGMRLTSTSHLDDITGDSRYPDPTTLASEDAVIMSDRSDGRLFPPGENRGKIRFITDVYFIGGVTLTYRLWPNGAGGGFRGAAVRCPRFY
ncbi:MAG: DUF6089 family protein [Bacteroidota bacterium]